MSTSTPTVTELWVEHRSASHLVGTSRPRLSWNITGGSLRQEWAEISVSRSRGDQILHHEGPHQVFVDWPAEPLASREEVSVRVRVCDDRGQVSTWSEPLTIEAGLLERHDWQVPLVVPPASTSTDGPRPTVLLRAEFDLDETPVRARLHATAHGLYRSELNGCRVGDDELAPGWTSYHHRLRTQTYDVTALLHAGRNAIGVELADGWFRGNIGFNGGVWHLYGEELGLIAQLEIFGQDAVPHIVDLSRSWACSHGGTTASALYEGESYDARLEPVGWSLPGFDDSGWVAPRLEPLGTLGARLESAVGPPVRQVERLDPVSVRQLDDGRWQLDFGQNISGRLELQVSGPAGSCVRLHHAEVLESGRLAVRPLRRAVAIDSYTLSGSGLERWQPRFTVHGFRYAEIEGWPGEFHSDSVRAVVVHSDMTRTGWFECSDPLLNQLHSNVVWSMRDNFVDLPTDCPQRDERMGWTGDIQVFAPTATFLYGCGGVLDSWLRDVADEQDADGSVPNFVPWVPCGFPEMSSPAWGDAAVIVPWTMFQRLGDRKVLAQQLASMRGWVDYLAHRADEDGVIRSGLALGDWLDPIAPPDRPGEARTDRYLVSTAYLIRSARLLAEAETELGLLDEAAVHSRLADRALAGLTATWMHPDGRLLDPSPTALALCLVFALVDDERVRARFGDELAGLVRAEGHRIATGFVGTPIVCDALAESGHLADTWGLLTQTGCPSWLYPVTMGATTIWERWDSMLPDGSINPGDMTSFNHYALGAVADFLHRVVAGLAPLAPGYRRVRFAPQPMGLTSASARLLSAYGLIESGWEKSATEFHLTATLPFGTTGVVVLPDGRSYEIGPGTHHFSTA